MFLDKAIFHAPMQPSQILALFPADEVSCLPVGCSALSRIFIELKGPGSDSPYKGDIGSIGSGETQLKFLTPNFAPFHPL